MRGKGEVADEHIYVRTERAKEENNRWRDWSKEDPQTFHARIAARLVELTIQHHPDKKSVGGPIDAVTLSLADGIQWVQRKPECPAN